MKTPLCVSITLLWLLATAATAQPEAKPVSSADSAPAAQPAGTPNPVPTPAQDDSTPADNDLKFVVAVFRHGVRTPLDGFNNSAPKHSGTPWPSPTAWGDGCLKGGDLTPQGATAVTLLGAWYGRNYAQTLGKNFSAYLWADVDERTQKTAAALATGFGASGISAKVESLFPKKIDPLFHPFKANCGTPDPAQLKIIVDKISKNYPDWLIQYKTQLAALQNLLACPNGCATPPPATPPPCQRLSCATASPTAWSSPTPTPAASPPDRPSSPITWDEQFSFASSATEAFLLEYANDMAPGWGKLTIEQTSDLLKLHEFYFNQTERDPYLAGIGSANLAREIFLQLSRKTGRPTPFGMCPRGDGATQFVGLVGHDTNLANLNTLLKIKWTFDDSQLPADTRNLPDNDAIPAGALVFELRGELPNYRVRIQYVAQGLKEIRDAPKPGDPYLIKTFCGGRSPCEMPFDDFKTLVADVINANGPFLSTCDGNNNQTCH